MANAKMVEAIEGFTTEAPGYPVTIATGEILDASDPLAKQFKDSFRDVKVRARDEPAKDTGEDEDVVDPLDTKTRKAEDEANAVEDPADLPGAPPSPADADDVVLTGGEVDNRDPAKIKGEDLVLNEGEPGDVENRTPDDGDEGDERGDVEKPETLPKPTKPEPGTTADDEDEDDGEVESAEKRPGEKRRGRKRGRPSKKG